MWNHYLEKKENNPNLEPFEMYFVKIIEDQINKLDPVFETNKQEEMKVANIQIAYKNRSIIQSLTERGRILKKAPADNFIARIKTDYGLNHF